MTTTALHQLLDLSSSRFPSRIAVEESGGDSIRYDELTHLSDRVRDRLCRMGVKPGDRVGMCLRKSADGIACIFGIMKVGAAYVPVDPTAPASRNALIFQNCGIKVLVVEERLEAGLRERFSEVGFTSGFIVLDGIGAGRRLTQTLDKLQARDPAPPVASV